METMGVFGAAAAAASKLYGLDEERTLRTLGFAERDAASFEAQAMIAYVRFGVNPVAEATGYDKMTNIIDIHLTDGRTTLQRDLAKGSPASPMS